MKITILTPHLKIAGGVIILVNYAHYLALRGHNVSLVVVNGNRVRRMIANLTKHKPKWMSEYKLNILRISKIEEDYLPASDILMFSTSHQAKLVKDFSEAKGGKYYLVQHDERLYHDDKESASYAYSLPFNFLTVSSWLQEMLKNDFDQEADLVLNTLNKEIFYPREIQRKDNKIRILMLYHTYNWKGSSEGLKILNELKEKYANIEIVLYGAKTDKVKEGDYDEYYYKPYGEDVAKIHSSCDIFLCPSWDEGFGIHPLEAIACGEALVTYDNGGSRDYAFNGKTALVAKRKNSQDLKDKLELLIKDEALRKRLSKQGLEFFATYPSWDEQVEKLEKILTK